MAHALHDAADAAVLPQLAADIALNISEFRDFFGGVKTEGGFVEVEFFRDRGEFFKAVFEEIVLDFSASHKAF